jgi:hypothetical protein
LMQHAWECIMEMTEYMKIFMVVWLA